MFETALILVAFFYSIKIVILNIDAVNLINLRIIYEFISFNYCISIKILINAKNIVAINVSTVRLLQIFYY